MINLIKAQTEYVRHLKSLTWTKKDTISLLEHLNEIFRAQKRLKQFKFEL